MLLIFMLFLVFAARADQTFAEEGVLLKLPIQLTGESWGFESRGPCFLSYRKMETPPSASKAVPVVKLEAGDAR